MKRAITVGLVVLGGGLLLLWKGQQERADTGRTGNGTTAVEKVQPVMPPVIELADEKRGSEAESVPEFATESASSKERRSIGENVPGEKSYAPEILDAVLCAEKKADFPALKVLQVGREMSRESNELIQGGCWNYADTVYSRAGYSEQKRQVVFQGGQETGLYADREIIRPGDWLFYIHHDYREARHSAIFVDWLDYEKQIGLMLSYEGKERGGPVRYSAYDLSKVYNIIRPLEE
ncbi:MAG: hypothetical protein D3908_03335 [Candidatus Electrothrix sp. AUS4]|nr:hypothetical protein [Candidatus Electrothrix sp. AUS4]